MCSFTCQLIQITRPPGLPLRVSHIPAKFNIHVRTCVRAHNAGGVRARVMNSTLLIKVAQGPSHHALLYRMITHVNSRQPERTFSERSVRGKRPYMPSIKCSCKQICNICK